MKPVFAYRVLACAVGLLAGVLLLELVLRAGGAALTWRRDTLNRAGLAERGLCRVLCLGGSTTAQGGPDSYPSQMEEILNSARTGTRFKVINAGVPGRDSGVILNSLACDLDRYEPDIVVGLIGNNDGRETVTYEEIDGGGGFGRAARDFLRSLKTVKLFRIMRARVANLLGGVERAAGERADGDAGPGTGNPRSMVYTWDSLPEDIEPMARTGWRLIEEKRYAEALEVFGKIAALHPEHVVGYDGMAQASLWMGDLDRARELRRKIVELDPDSAIAHAMYGRRCIGYDDMDEGVAAMYRAIELEPGNVENYMQVAYAYWSCGQREKTDEVIARARENDISHGMFYGLVATNLVEKGRFEAARKYYRAAHLWRMRNVNLATRENYARIADAVTGRGIRMICVQDPVVSVRVLKKLLGGRRDVVYVDNEKNFKDALSRGPYSELFADCFGGEFGHATRKGNRLLAQNVARAVLRVCGAEKGGSG